jgi:hypothetical protein
MSLDLLRQVVYVECVATERSGGGTEGPSLGCSDLHVYARRAAESRLKEALVP